MKRNYYQVSIVKDTSGNLTKEMDRDAATYRSIIGAKQRQKVRRTGSWHTKLIGQTPKRWVFRVRFDSANWY